MPGCALAIEAAFREAGFPDDLFRTVLVPSRDVRALIEDPAVAAVTLTGSVAAGVKESGYGRECSYLGIREFANVKSVLVQE